MTLSLGLQMFKCFAIKGMALLISESNKAKARFYEEFCSLQVAESGNRIPEQHFYY